MNSVFLVKDFFGGSWMHLYRVLYFTETTHIKISCWKLNFLWYLKYRVFIIIIIIIILFLTAYVTYFSFWWLRT